ncbi:hypothetical protein EY05_14740 [Staphylococcus aureus]|nr:hypothetical protein EY05_14740 [Staphylococcus aureus]PHX08587.1 hypothetical protein NX96_14175 [Staphylococcus aureus]
MPLADAQQVAQAAVGEVHPASWQQNDVWMEGFVCIYPRHDKTSDWVKPQSEVAGVKLYPDVAFQNPVLPAHFQVVLHDRVVHKVYGHGLGVVALGQRELHPLIFQLHLFVLSKRARHHHPRLKLIGKHELVHIWHVGMQDGFQVAAPVRTVVKIDGLCACLPRAVVIVLNDRG